MTQSRSQPRSAALGAVDALDVPGGSDAAGPMAPFATACSASRGSQPAQGQVALLARLARLGATVSELGAALGLAPERLARNEALDRLEAQATLSVEALLALDTERVAVWFETLGDDLALDLRLAGQNPDDGALDAQLRADQEPARRLGAFQERVAAGAESYGDAVVVEARLALAKTQALALARELMAARPEWLGQPEALAQTRLVVYYFAAAWNRLLTLAALPDWERLGLATRDGRACALLCDAEGYLAGMTLDVIGARLADTGEPPRWLAVSRAAWRHFHERAQATRRLREEEVGWADAPATLTPAHLRVEPRQPGLEATQARLDALRAGFAAAYLASAVQVARQGARPEWTARFAGPRPASCSLTGAQADAPGPDGEVFAGQALGRLAAWAYDNASPDKLAIAREALARELAPGATVALAEVERAAVPALDAARANFTLYLRGQTERYFALRQQALDAVGTYSEAVRKAVSDMTGDVVENVYRTAGLLVGVAIAWLIQPSASPVVGRLAALLYSAYIAFIIGFVLRARWQRFELEAAELDTRLAAMSELSESERGRIRMTAGRADALFQRYFRWTRWAYLALGLAGLLVFVALWTPLAAHLTPVTPAPHVTPK